MNKDGRVVLMAVLVVEMVFIMRHSTISPLPPQATPCYWCPRWWSGTPPGQIVYNTGLYRVFFFNWASPEFDKCWPVKVTD